MFRAPTSLKQAQLKTGCNGCHFERMRGTPTESSDYCKGGTSASKDKPVNEIFVEYGELVEREATERGPKEFFRAIADGLSKLDAYDQFPTLMVQRPKLYDDYSTTLVKHVKRIREDELQYPNVVIYTGPTGSGKSWHAYRDHLVGRGLPL